jgi:serine/threonine protein kinase
MNAALKPALTLEYDGVEAGVEPELITRGRYQICMELASGGMGTVYLALYRGVDGFERVVAIKRMHPHMSSQARFVEMFFDEAQSMARVHHPAICALIDLGKLDNSYYMAMDYLEGEPLSACMEALANTDGEFESTRLPALAARIVARLCDGLEAVHQARDAKGQALELVHCDITPQNLFVLYDGTVRLTDFGIARTQRIRESSNGTLPHGKVAYVAPEALKGSEPDRRSDVWSMGVVLWELLCGTRLFDGRRTKEVAQQVLKRTITQPSALNPRVPAALDAIVARALARDPALRFPSARALANALEDFLADLGDSVSAADVGTWVDHLFPGRASHRRGLRATARAIAERLLPPSVRPLDGFLGAANSAAAEPPAGEQMEWGRIQTIQLASSPQVAEAAAAALPPTAASATPSMLLGAGMIAGCTALGLLFFGFEAGWFSQWRAASRPVAATILAAPAAAPNRSAADPAAAFAPADTTDAIFGSPQARPAAAHPPPTAAELGSPPKAAAPIQPQPTAAKRAKLSPPSAAADPAIAQGSVYISSTPPGAEIVWQGRVLGRTPFRIRLPAGPQEVRLRRDSSSAGTPLRLQVEEDGDSIASVKLD